MNMEAKDPLVLLIATNQGGHGKAGAYTNSEEEYKTLKRRNIERSNLFTAHQDPL